MWFRVNDRHIVNLSRAQEIFFGGNAIWAIFPYSGDEERYNGDQVPIKENITEEESKDFLFHLFTELRRKQSGKED